MASYSYLLLGLAAAVGFMNSSLGGVSTPTPTGIALPVTLTGEGEYYSGQSVQIATLETATQILDQVYGPIEGEWQTSPMGVDVGSTSQSQSLLGGCRSGAISLDLSGVSNTTSFVFGRVKVPNNRAKSESQTSLTLPAFLSVQPHDYGFDGSSAAAKSEVSELKLSVSGQVCGSPGARAEGLVQVGLNYIIYSIKL